MYQSMHYNGKMDPRLGPSGLGGGQVITGLNPHSYRGSSLGDLGPVTLSAYSTSQGCCEGAMEEKRTI